MCCCGVKREEIQTDQKWNNIGKACDMLCINNRNIASDSNQYWLLLNDVLFITHLEKTIILTVVSSENIYCYVKRII